MLWRVSDETYDPEVDCQVDDGPNRGDQARLHGHYQGMIGNRK